MYSARKLLKLKPLAVLSPLDDVSIVIVVSIEWLLPVHVDLEILIEFHPILAVNPAPWNRHHLLQLCY